MGMSVTATWRVPGAEGGVEVFSGMVDKFQERWQDLSDPLTEIAQDVFEPFISQQFSTSGMFLGTPWAPLKESTVRRKTRKLESASLESFNPLAGGLLQESFQSGGDGHVEVIDKPDESTSRLLWGSDLPGRGEGTVLARIHHFGAPERGLPSRPILVDSPEIGERVRQILSDFASRVGQEVWGGEGQVEFVGWGPLQ